MARVDTQLRRVPIVVALIAIFLAGSVQAQQPDYSASGPYVGIGFGIGFENFDDDGMDLDVDPAYGFDAWDDFTGESVDETAFAARFGGGIDFYLTESIALNVNSAYVLPTGDLDGGDYISLVVGAQFRF